MSGALPDGWRLGVVGAGVMGGEIAELGALAGVPTTLVDVDPAALERARAATATRLARARARGRLDEDPEAVEARVTRATDLAALEPCDVVVEAAPERQEVKDRLFAALGALGGGPRILASNTSGLSISAMAAGTPDPSRVLGLHFFNPATRMALVEVIRAEHTSDATQAAGMEVARALGKTPVAVRERPGFVVNRVLVRAIAEALRAAGDAGTDPAEVDAAVVADGPAPMGPFALSDLIGLDTLQSITEHLVATLGSRFDDGGAVAARTAAGRLGRKSGAGFYDGPPPSGAEATAAGRAVARRYYAAAAEEAAGIARAGIAVAGDIDLAMRLGAGWAAGPLEGAG